MVKTFKVEIVTPERVLFAAEDVVSLMVPAEEGYYGVLAGHAPFLGTLRPGEISIRRERGEQHFMTSGGFMEVTPQRAIVLSEGAEEASSIDVRKAEDALDRARQKLAGGLRGVEREQAEAAREEAEIRLKTARKYQK
ncbi:MAG: ATP synthase F1 subunit epsilon [Planctomycetes bacterium]|nr:ATP synthase F1 subunit epsilon [Planctomycetota bacterium]